MTDWQPRICGGIDLVEPKVTFRRVGEISVVTISGPIYLVNQLGKPSSLAWTVREMLAQRPVLLVLDSLGGECRSGNFLGGLQEEIGDGLAVHIRQACGTALLVAIESEIRFMESGATVGDLREFIGGREIHGVDIDPKYVARKCGWRFTDQAYRRMVDGQRLGTELAEHYGIASAVTGSVEETIEALQEIVFDGRFCPCLL